MDNNTKVLLGIKDKNIKIINTTVSFPEGSSTLILSGILDYRPIYCPKCGIIDSTQIIWVASDHGTFTTKLRKRR